MADTWGGARPGAGRKRLTPEQRAERRKQRASRSEARAPVKRSDTVAAPAVQTQRMLPSVDSLMALIETSQKHARQKRPADFNPFAAVALRSAFKGKNGDNVAMDEALSWAQQTAAIFNAAGTEGLTFPGYPFLTELAQRAEYRIMVGTIAEEATRKWIKLKATGDSKQKPKTDVSADRAPPPEPDPEADLKAEADEEATDKKSDKIKELTDFLDNLKVRDRYAEISAHDGFFGSGHLFHDFSRDSTTGASEEELKTDIGDGRNTASKAKVTKGMSMRLQAVEPVWCNPMAYNTTNPLRPDWYRPQTWYVMGQEIHVSRLPLFVSRPVPDLLKPAYMFGGLSLSQIAMPYVNSWLTTRESVTALIHSFSVMCLMTDLATILQPGNSEGLMARAALFNAMRDNQGLMVVNKESEDFKNVSASLSGLHELQAQAQEHMFSVSRIPAVKFAGIQPAGLNASSEGEIRAFYDTIAAYQNFFFRPNLTRTIDFAQLCLWGEVDQDIVFDFEPLWELTAKEKSDLRKTDADRDGAYIDKGVLGPEEVRAKLAFDPESGYDDIDPENMPDPPMDMDAGGGAAPGEGGDPGGMPPGGGKPKQAAAEDADILPFAADEFREADHPRAPDGKFGSGSGGGKSAKGKAPPEGKTLEAKSLRKVGNQMGSNPGGVFEDDSGRRYYVKKGKSADHVRNELAAAKLYQLAGAPTLNYRDVDGGLHVATEMANLGKKRVQDFTAAERAKAQEDFVVHAWLGNWDAVGLEGDNQGTVNGVPTSLDLGGALEYRAQGAPKGSAFGTSVGELDTLRDPKINPISAKVFGGMKPEQIRTAAAKVTGLSDADIRSTVKAAGADDKLADKLIARRDDIAKRLGIAGPVGGAAGGKTEKEFGGASGPGTYKNAKTGKIEQMPSLTKPAEGPGSDLTDESFSWLETYQYGVDGVDAKEVHHPLPSDDVIKQLGKYVPTEAVILWRAERTDPQTGQLVQSWTRSEELAREISETNPDSNRLRSRRFYPDEIVVDTSMIPSYAAAGAFSEVVVAKAKFQKHLRQIRHPQLAERLKQAHDEANFEESKHPRDADGKFASGPGGGGESDPETPKLEDVEKYAPLFFSAMKTHMHSGTGLENGIAILKKAAANNATEIAAMAYMSKDEIAALKQKHGSLLNAYKAVKSEASLENFQIDPAKEGQPYTPKQQFKSKKEHAAHLLQKPGGVTTAEMLKALQWPSISMPQMAKTLGMKLEKVKSGGVTKYIGTPMSAEEKAAAKAETKAKTEAKPAPAPAKPPDPAKPVTKATPEELKKAAKVTNVPIPTGTSPAAHALINKFNQKYGAGTAQLTDPAALEQKIDDYKKLQTQIAANNAEYAQAQKVAQEKKNKSAAEALKKQQAESAAQNKEFMEALGISSTEAAGFTALAKMHGNAYGSGGSKDLIAKFKAWENQAKSLGYPISGFQYALIRDYINGGYTKINPALRSPNLTIEQHVYTRMVNDALEKLPKHTGEVLRGADLDPDVIATYKPGFITQEAAFTSTGKGFKFNGNVHFTIKAIGKRGADLSTGANKSEKEVLFKAGTRFLVHKKENKNGITYIEMEEVEHHG